MSQTGNASAGKLDFEGGMNGNGLSGLKRLAEEEFDNIDVLGMEFPFGGCLIHAKIQRVNVPQFFVHGIKHELISRAELLAGKSGFGIFVRIGPYVNPKKFQGIRRIIGVFECHITLKHVGFIVERNVDGISHVLLEIILGMEKGSASQQPGTNSESHQ